MTRAQLGASALMTLALSTPAFAQGKSQQHKGTERPPSRNALATVAPAAAVVPSSNAAPLAWVDDASLLAPGTVSFSVSAMHWHNGDVGEIDVPVVEAAIGLAPRLQLSASVPHVVGSSDPAGAVGGMGTSFFSTKVGLYESRTHSFQVASSPTVLVVGRGILDPSIPSQSRLRWGLPVTAEISRGGARLYGGGGYFSPGLWFGGAALGFRVDEKTMASAGFSRAWHRADVSGLPLSQRDRKEISGGLARALARNVVVFGSIGRTIATLDENGAGTTISGGLSVSVATAAVRP